ncbi:MAG TPA: hypothetical protein VND19_12105 [Acetobacteraceae bacterium]|nr:hypothetical protein [Acetobacteraceae bacterium]
MQQRRYRAVSIAKAERTLARLRADLESLDAVIEASGRPIRRYTSPLHRAPRGGIAKATLDVLRVAGRPMTAVEIAEAMPGGWIERIGRRALAERVRVALMRQAANGTVRRTKGPGRRVVCVSGGENPRVGGGGRRPMARPPG